MKPIALAFVLLAAASNAIAQSVQVFGVGIEVRETCEVMVNRKDGRSENLKTSFPEAGRCRFLPNSETDIPRIEFIQGDYVLLVESRLTTAEACRARLAAITISRDGQLRLSKPTQHNSACGSAERKDYEILRHHSIRLN
jgi:hypothetical protein